MRCRSVPPYNNSAESDIRSVVAGRADGRVDRTDWGDNAFAIGKTIVRACRKTGVNLLRCSLDALDKIRAGQPPPLPLPDTG